MNQSKAIIDTLKSHLRAARITYKEIAQHISMSESSVKRIFSEQTMPLERVEKICQLLNLSLYELLHHAQSEHRQPNQLSLEQETILAQDNDLFTVFYLLVNQWNILLIRDQLKLTEAVLESKLAILKNLGLIEIQSTGRIQLNVSGNLRWIVDGPIWKVHSSQVLGEFFAHNFTAADEFIAFETAELSKESMQMITRKYRDLQSDIVRLAKLDRLSPTHKKSAVGCLLAFRPWVYSLVQDMKKTPKQPVS